MSLIRIHKVIISLELREYKQQQAENTGNIWNHGPQVLFDVYKLEIMLALWKLSYHCYGYDLCYNLSYDVTVTQLQNMKGRVPKMHKATFSPHRNHNHNCNTIGTLGSWILQVS